MNHELNKKWTRLTACAIIAACGATASAQVALISDGFGDGDRNNDGTLEGTVEDAGDTGAAWWYVSGFSSQTISIVDDSSGIGSGNALDVVSTTTSSRPIGASFPATTLNDGDRLSLSFTVRITESPIDPTDGGEFPGVDSDRRFRFGLYSSNGTPITAMDVDDFNFPMDDMTNDDTGYTAFIDAGSGEGNTYSALGDKADGILGGSSVSLGATSSDPNHFIDNSPHTLELILRRTGDTMQVAILFDGELAQDGEAAAADILAENLPFTFDEVAFGTSGASFDYRIDDILVEYTAAPEGSALTDGFEDGDRENDGIPEGAVNDASDLGFAWYKSRGTSDFEVAVIDDSSGIGTGNAMNLFSLTTSTRPVSAAFEDVELAQDGDSVSFAFDVRVLGLVPSSDRRFRFGIHSDGGTPVTSDSSSETGNDPGYMVQMDTGASSSSTATVRGDLANGLFSGGTRSLGGTTEEPQFSLDDNDTHRLELKITRIFDMGLGRDVNMVDFYMDGVLATSGIDMGDDGDDAANGGPADPLAVNTFMFNQISVGTSSVSFLDFVIDNVEVTVAVADDSCPADQNGDGIFNNTDINLFVSNFLSQQPAADQNGDGIYNNTDINLFVSNFLTQCM